MTCMTDVTRILRRIESGESGASEELLPLIYEELRRLAAHHLSGEPAGHSLQATALVHEAHIRLVDTPRGGIREGISIRRQPEPCDASWWKAHDAKQAKSEVGKHTESTSSLMEWEPPVEKLSSWPLTKR